MKETDSFSRIFRYLWLDCDLASDSMDNSQNPRTSKSLEVKILKEYLKINI